MGTVCRLVKLRIYQAAIGAAEWSGSFGAQYMQPVGSMMWFTELDVNFTDDYFMTGDLDGIDVQEGYELVNLRTGLRGENWMLMVYGRNITDELIATGAADVPWRAVRTSSTAPAVRYGVFRQLGSFKLSG